jgi:hypothetical protein
MKRVSDRFLQLAVLFGLVGMGLGVWMGKTENFTLAPAHAHINLLGWVSMALYGLFYRAIPKAAEGVLPLIHFWVALISYLVMVPALIMFLLGNKGIDMVLGLSTMGVWVGMAVFTIIVWRATWKAE